MKFTEILQKDAAFGIKRIKPLQREHVFEGVSIVILESIQNGLNFYF